MKQSKCSTICVKVENLRKVYGKDMNLKKWCEDENNVLCCRQGRVFITVKDEENPEVSRNELFHYPKSKWCNPYKVDKGYSLATSLAAFYNHVLETDLKNDLHELVGKTLGCFCDQSKPCHVQVLQRFVDMIDELPEPFYGTIIDP